MTETTTSAGPELSLVKAALSGLRADLCRNVRAYRPLPRAAADSAWIRLFPLPMRDEMRVLPHVGVLGLALLTFAVGAESVSFGADAYVAVLCGILVAAPVALTLLRPVLAWWVSLSAAAVLVFVTGGSPTPWPAGSLVGHTLVMMIVAARTGPRTAAGMWALSTLYGIVVTPVTGGDWYNSDALPMLVASGIAVALVTLVQVNRTARREVVQERTAGAVERDRRTLLEERTNIARELHDVVAHHMSVVAIQAEAAPYRVENPPPELEQAFVTIRENAVAALTELRRVLGVVRAEDYEAPDAPQPTLADLDRLVENVRDAGLTVDQAVTGAVRALPPGVELSAYRIVQEALSNVLRHAPGAPARVEVAYVLGGLGLRIVNGPPGSLVKPSPGAGHGVTGMRERVAMLDGEMTAGTTDDGGYEVSVFVPVAAASAETEEDDA
ncbi:sensor histidine kinase [Streptomyces sp. NPDC050145]|uniref:sensor histidine kinase n=1 Tax=Streptomyces sp. NPDC050145 TaxID=3365602 RepID=UPI0037B1D52F